MGVNILKGKSIMSVSLPVMICAKSTLLQAFASNFVFIPIFGLKASKETDPVK